MGLLNGEGINMPLLRAAQALQNASRSGGSTWSGITDGLLGYSQGKSDIEKQKEAKEQADFNRKFRMSQLANIDARTNQIRNPAQPDLPTLQQNYRLAQKQGYQGSFIEYQTALKNAGRTTIENNIGGGPKLPTGSMWVDENDPTQGVTALPGSTTEKALNTVPDVHVKASSFATRMVEAESMFESLTSDGYDPTNIPDAIAGGTGVLGNYANSPGGQQYSQAQKDWVRAKLRKESGAVIGADEMADEITTYFPQPGDGPEVIAQKTRARKIATNALINESQGSYKGDPYNLDPIAKPSGSRFTIEVQQ